MEPFCMVMTSIPLNSPWHREQEYIWIMGGDLNSLHDIRVPCVRFKGNETTPYGHDLYTNRCYFTQKENIYGFGMRISTVFQISWYFMINGGRNYHIQSWLTYHQMLLDTRNKNIYGLGMEKATVFQLFGHLLFQKTEPPPNVMTYIYMYIYQLMVLVTKGKNIPYIRFFSRVANSAKEG
jgi:hypothetical protein